MSFTVFIFILLFLFSPLLPPFFLLIFVLVSQSCLLFFLIFFFIFFCFILPQFVYFLIPSLFSSFLLPLFVFLNLLSFSFLYFSLLSSASSFPFGLSLPPFYSRFFHLVCFPLFVFSICLPFLFHPLFSFSFSCNSSASFTILSLTESLFSSFLHSFPCSISNFLFRDISLSSSISYF